MRTTIDLDPKAHKLAKALAHQRKVSLGKIVSEAIMERFCPEPTRPVKYGISEAGFPTIDTGRPVTLEEVKAFLEEED